MRQRLSAAAAASLVLSLLALLGAAPYAGEQLAGTITTTIDTGSAYVGQPVTATNVQSESGSITGAKMYGHVTSVVRAGQGRSAKLQIVFTRLVLPNGASYAIDGVVDNVQANTKSNALKEVGGALGGMIVGNIIGKTIFHTGAGGFLGAAGGFLLAKNSRANMTIPAGSAVRVTLRSARRQATR